MEELLEQIKRVALARQQSQELNTKKKMLYDEFQAQHTEFFSEIVKVEAAVTEAENKLRTMTIMVYQDTGNKAPAPGVGIREVTRLEYDSKAAFNWAMEHKIALKLDVSGFEKIAKTAPETRPEFVKVSVEPQATIATDLNKILEAK